MIFKLRIWVVQYSCLRITYHEVAFHEFSLLIKHSFSCSASKMRMLQIIID